MALVVPPGRQGNLRVPLRRESAGCLRALLLIALLSPVQGWAQSLSELRASTGPSTNPYAEPEASEVRASSASTTLDATSELDGELKREELASEAELAKANDESAKSEEQPTSEVTKSDEAKASDGGTWPFEHFFDHIDVRGYTQLRLNFSTNDRLVNLQGDKSVGGTPGFFIRRARLVLYGKIHPQVSVYLQPDFASAPSSRPLNFAQMRDWYFDLSDPTTEFRLRIGQSKVPFGFENMQSSQNRLPLDRSDPVNSAVANERDIGVFFYYAPREIRQRFKHLVASGLKGSGDYGMVGLGIYNGQTANQPELNKNKHVVARVTYPFLFGDQYLELGASGYTGKFVVQKSADVGGADEFQDTRVQASFILYPQPFGLQVEYNVGIGPEFHAFSGPATNGGLIGEVRDGWLHGGYALVSLKLDNVIPYARGMLYEGGKKHELNAPNYSVRELEVGIEWQIIKQLELVGAYALADRTFPEPPFEQESGQLFRFQAQVNY